MDYLIGATLGAMLLLLFAGISTHKDEEKSQAPSDEDESLREENARQKKELSELEESHSFTIALFERALITNANKSNEIKVLLQQKEELQKKLLEQVNNQTGDSDVEA